MFLTEMPEDDAQGCVDYMADPRNCCVTIEAFPQENYTVSWREVTPSDCLSLY